MLRSIQMCIRDSHWAVRQEKLPFFVHFRHIRTACQRCVQWPHPTKRGAMAPYGATSGSVRFGVEKEKRGMPVLA